MNAFLTPFRKSFGEFRESDFLYEKRTVCFAPSMTRPVKGDCSLREIALKKFYNIGTVTVGGSKQLLQLHINQIIANHRFLNRLHSP